MSNKNARIAIIGGGPSGLTLARILQQNGMKATVYEREPSSNSRQQGGTLDMHPESGQYALEVAGLIQEFEVNARYEGQDLRLLDKTGKVYWDEISGPEDNHRPEIDRGVLRKLLLDSIEPNTIKWGHHLKSINSLDNGQLELHFENEHTELVDLVVGADGAFSRVREFLSDVQPIYTGISAVEMGISNVDEIHPDLAEFNGKGSMFAFQDQKAIMAQLNGDGRIRVYLAFRIEKEWLDNCGIKFEQPTMAKESLLQLLSDWSDDLKNYIRYSDGEMLPRRIYMLPIDHSWTHKDGVTLIGDSAHLMSPFAGKGANIAMLDAAELGLSLANHSDLKTALEHYEKKMFVYSSKATLESDMNLKLSFSHNAAHKFLDIILRDSTGKLREVKTRS